MALTKCNVPGDVIGSLATRAEERGLTPQEFKDKFDEMPEGIKQYINDVLTEEIDAHIADYLAHKADDAPHQDAEVLTAKGADDAMVLSIGNNSSKKVYLINSSVYGLPAIIEAGKQLRLKFESYPFTFTELEVTYGNRISSHTYEYSRKIFTFITSNIPPLRGLAVTNIANIVIPESNIAVEYNTGSAPSVYYFDIIFKPTAQTYTNCYWKINIVSTALGQAGNEGAPYLYDAIVEDVPI